MKRGPIPLQESNAYSHITFPGIEQGYKIPSGEWNPVNCPSREKFEFLSKKPISKHLKKKADRLPWKDVLETLDRADVYADFRTCVYILRGCGDAMALSEGKRAHSLVIKNGREHDEFLGNLVLLMYCKCGVLQDARDVFASLHQRNVFSWSIMIGAYADHRLHKEALEHFSEMYVEGMMPDKVTFTTILCLCNTQAALSQGKQIHVQIVNSGIESDVVVGTALLYMYSRCGSLENAQRMFDRMPERNVVSWTAMIAACVQYAHGEEALTHFQQMQMEGMAPNKVTFVSLLEACACTGSLTGGKWMHTCIVERKFHLDVLVGNSLISMYSKCGSLEDACTVFDKMLKLDVVSWTAMLTAYVQHGHYRYAFWLFEQMLVEGVLPDRVTFISIVDACASKSALPEGKQIHVRILGSANEHDVVLGTALINMYGKCGKLDDGRRIFDTMVKRTLVTWNAIIAAYAQQGHGQKVLQLFKEMQVEGVTPDNVTFFSILSACSHTGLVDEGFRCFTIMCRDYGIAPTVEHYNCMIGILGRVGCLNDGENLMNNMPVQPTARSYIALLGACKRHADVVRGERALEHVFEL